MNNLYVYIERAGSSANTIDFIFYIDVNNNDVMEYREPVYHISWSGANRNVTVKTKNYNPSILNILLNTISVNLDGAKLMGTLTDRGNPGPGSSSGKGSADGKSIEIRIPFTQITKLNTLGNVEDQLTFSENFKFHLSSINGGIGSVPGSNSINDNFGGCLNAPTFISYNLPIKLESFSAQYDQTNVILNWASSMEKDFSHYVLESSSDGIVFSTTAIVFGTAIDGLGAKYNYTDRSVNGRSGLVYYRLRMVDIDGKESFSAIRIVMLGEPKKSLTVTTFPNPVVSEVRVMVPASWQNKTVVYEVYGANGQPVKTVQTASASQTETINMSSLASGLYVVRVSCEGQIAQQKIVKQ
jgi:hypothetical protein